MRHKKIAFAVIGVFLITYSCKDIFERNLEKDSVTLLSPPDNHQTTVLAHNFKWEEVKGADDYNLQIAVPSFSNLVSFVLDTNITETEFQFVLSTGSYEWQVRAQNNSSMTDYTTFILTIDSTPDLTNQPMVLISPSDIYATSDTSITFSWYPLSIADYYQFEIYTPDINGTWYIPPAQITDDSVTYTLGEGFYEWRVRAENDISVSDFSASRTLIIDLTDPSTPTLQSPSNNDTLTSFPVAFSWGRGATGGSVIKDSLLIYSDTANWAVSKQYYTSDTTQTVDTLGANTYYWHVKSIDAAGNKSNYSTLRKFYVQ